MPSVFITRTLKEGSRFREILEARGFTVSGYYLIRFSQVPFSKIPDCDWIFFYSSKAVQFFFEGIGNASIVHSPDTSLAALGEGTAQKLLDMGVVPDFVGSGHPEHTATAFLAVAENQRVLFPHARLSKRSVQELLGERIKSIDMVVYDNEIRNDSFVPAVDFLVFTSPLNVKAYFNYQQLSSKTKCIAIGDTTAKALRAQGIADFTISESATEEGLAEAVCSLQQ